MKGITPNKENTGLRFLIFWRQPDWGFYNRRNEAFARELAKRHGVNCVIHVEWLALRGLFGILLRYFRTRDKALKAALDERPYAKGIKVSNAELAAIQPTPDEFHGEWNYRIHPTPSDNCSSYLC